MVENLPDIPDKLTFIENIKKFPEVLSATYDWLRSDEFKPFVDTLATLGSFAMGDPTGLVLPTILNCADSLIRKRAEKHIPDLVQILIIYKPTFNMKIVQSDFGQQLLRDIVDKIIHEVDEEKIHYLKAFLVSTFSQPIENYSLYQKYRDMLFQMDPARLQILATLSNPRHLIEPIITEKKQDASETPHRIDGFNIPNDYNLHLRMDILLFGQSINELKTQGLLKNSGVHGIGLDGDQLSDRIAPLEQLGVEFEHSKKFAERYSNSALKYRERTLIQIEVGTIDFITDFGWSFIQFFKAPKELSAPKSLASID